MGKIVFSYHNKKHSVTTFRGLYQNKRTKKLYFFVDVDGHTGLISYYGRMVTYMKRPSSNEYVKLNNFSYAKTLLDAHNSWVQGTMQTCNKQIELQQTLYDGTTAYMTMTDLLSQAFITYHGQTF